MTTLHDSLLNALRGAVLDLEEVASIAVRAAEFHRKTLVRLELELEDIKARQDLTGRLGDIEGVKR